MAAQISFIAGGYGLPINNLSGSGLGFYGAGGFGTSVAVGAWQGTTYITDGNGVSRGPQVNNVQYVHPNSGVVQNGTTLNLLSIPAYQSTLGIHFTNSTPVRTQNAFLYAYDRTSLSNAPSGVTTAVCPIIHPGNTQVQTGSGSAAWEFPQGSSVCYLSRYNNGVLYSPGQSGYGVNGGSTIDMTHDFSVCISQSPNSIGAKVLNGIFVSMEYL